MNYLTSTSVFLRPGKSKNLHAHFAPEYNEKGLSETESETIDDWSDGEFPPYYCNHSQKHDLTEMAIQTEAETNGELVVEAIACGASSRTHQELEHTKVEAIEDVDETIVSQVSLEPCQQSEHDVVQFEEDKDTFQLSSVDRESDKNWPRVEEDSQRFQENENEAGGQQVIVTQAFGEPWQRTENGAPQIDEIEESNEEGGLSSQRASHEHRQPNVQDVDQVEEGEISEHSEETDVRQLHLTGSFREPWQPPGIDSEWSASPREAGVGSEGAAATPPLTLDNFTQNHDRVGVDGLEMSDSGHQSPPDLLSPSNFGSVSQQEQINIYRLEVNDSGLQSLDLLSPFNADELGDFGAPLSTLDIVEGSEEDPRALHSAPQACSGLEQHSRPSSEPVSLCHTCAEMNSQPCSQLDVAYHALFECPAADRSQSSQERQEQWIHLYNLLEPRHRKILSNPTIRRKSPQPEKQAKSVGRAGDHHIHTPIVVNHSHASSAFSRPAPLGASRDQEDEKEVQRSMQQQEEEKEIVESVRETLVLDQCKAEVERERETARPSARMRAIGTVTNTGKGRSSRKAKWVDASPAARDAQQQMPAGVPASDDVAAREVMLLQHRCHLLQRELDKINGAKPGVSHKATLMKDPARADVKLPDGVEELTSHGRTKPRRDRKHTGPSRKRHGAVTIQHKHRGLVDGTTDLELDFEDPDLQQLLADYADLARQYARVHSAVTNAEDILHGAKIGCRYVPLGAGSDSQWEWGKLQQKPVCGSPDTSITRCRPSWDCESVPSRSPERPWLASPSSGDANRFSLNRSWSSHQHLAGPLGNDPRYEGSVRRSTADIYSGASPTPAWTPWSPRRCHPSPHRHRAMDWRPRQNTTSASSYKPTAAILQTELLEDGLAKVERELNLLSTTLNQCRRAVSAW